MYLARGILNPASRAVQHDLSDVSSLHRTLMRAFEDHLGDEPRRTASVLYRVDEDQRRGLIALFVQGRKAPDFSKLPNGYFVSVADDLDLALAGEADNPSIRNVDKEREQIANGDQFVFRLRANTTKKILTKSLPDGTKQNGKRVPVRGDEERLQWLKRHADAGGFLVVDVRITEVQPAHGRSKDRTLTFAGGLFEGVLSVTDVELFRRTLADGIGPAKAFGFGLLSIQRMR